MTTLGELKTILARGVGDALTNGSPAYTQGSGFKWSEPEYNAAFDFAVDMLKRMFMVRQEATVVMTHGVSIYDFTPPTNMIYVDRLTRETGIGSGQYERAIPLEWVTVNRVASQPVLHFDRQSMLRTGTYLGSARILMQGYQYPTKPAGSDAAHISISEPAVVMAARYFLHLNTPTRDPQQLLQGFRLAEQARLATNELVDNLGYFEPDGGLWLGDS